VERISTLLNHPIRLNSVPGKGASFTIEVPRAVAEAKTDGESVPSRSATLNQLSGLLVLCVDNDKNILDGMTGLLEKWGCQVQTATDRTGAIGLVRGAGTESRLPDIALIDYHLDDEDTGLGLIEELRVSGGHALPCVLVTADRSTDLKKQAEAMGVSILNKPVKPAALRAVLSQHSAHLQATAAE